MKIQKIKPEFPFIFLTMLCIMVLIGCNGCRSGRVENSRDIEMSDKASDTVQIVARPQTVKTSLSMDSIDYYVRIYEQSKNISLLPADDSIIDEYNVRKYVLEFRSPETREIIKTIDLVKENPFHKMGLKRRKEPYPTVYYFLMPEGADNKNALRKFLPQETFHEIPFNFEMERAISKIFVSTTVNKYVTVSYELEWLPDAYSDEGEWDGPGYGVHLAVVYDSLGNKLFTRQFDGTSVLPSVSEDGKYLFTMACLSPVWDENIRYRFSVVNMQTDKVVYEELIENCKRHGGGGNFYPNFYNANGYYVEFKNNQVLGFTYVDSKLYRYLDELKFEVKTKSKNEFLLTYPNKNTVTIHIDSLYTQIDLTK